MILKIRERLIYFSEAVHLKIFGHEMSNEMRDFIKNLSWSFFGGIIAAVVMFAINIFAGRLLGPVEYGKYNYLLSLATATAFIFLLGNNLSGVRYISDKKYNDKKNSILTAAFVMSLVQATVFLIVIVLLSGFIANHFNFDKKIVYLIFVLGFVLSFKDLFDSFLRALNLIKKQSLFKIVDATIVAILFFMLLYFFKKEFSYFDYVYALMSGGVFSIVALFYSIRKNIVKFKWEQVFLLLHYNKFLIFAAMGGFIIGLDKVFIGKYIGTESLGIYSAYYAASQLVMINFVIIFMNIFWPATINNKHNIREIVKKVNTIIFKFFPFFVGVNFLSIYFIVLLFGKQYPMQFTWVLLFAFSSIFSIIFYIFLNLLNIDRIARSIVVSLICYSLVILSIIVFKNIVVYLIFQIIVYWIAIYYIKKVLMAENEKALSYH